VPVLAPHPLSAFVSTESSGAMSESDDLAASAICSRTAQQGSLASSENSLPSRPASGRMCLTAEQRSKIASAYEKAAADEALPAQLRIAFVKKAKWFRMLYQIEVAKLSASFVSGVVESAPKRGYLSLAEKLNRARAAKGIS
jgi:hypothetical protein